jgi:hypothetical protein
MVDRVEQVTNEGVDRNGSAVGSGGRAAERHFVWGRCCRCGAAGEGIGDGGEDDRAFCRIAGERYLSSALFEGMFGE